MRTYISVLVCFAMAAVACAKDVAPAMSSKDPAYADVVEQFFPQALRDGRDVAAAHLRPGKLESAFAVTDFNSSSDLNQGRKYIVAAYSNVWSGCVRVLQRSGDTWSLASEAAIPQYVNSPFVDLRDIDGDGVPEVIVQYSTGGARVGTWLYHWRDTGLRSLWDAENADDGGGLDVANFVDLDGDGKLEAIVRGTVQTSQDEDGETVTTRQATFAAYRLSNGVYEPWKELVTFQRPTPRKDRNDVPFSATFTVPTQAAQYLVRVVHRGEGWNVRATVSLNGVLIGDSKVFSPEKGVLQVPVALAGTNTFSVTHMTTEGPVPSTGEPPHLTITVEKQ